MKKVLASSTQFLQLSKDSLEGLQMSTIVLECHRSGLTTLICATQNKSYLFTAWPDFRRNTGSYIRFTLTRTISCEIDHLEVVRSTSTHLSHSNLEFFDYSVVKVQNKKPEKHFLSSLAVISNLVIFACLIRGSHAPIGITKLPRKYLPGFVSLIIFAKVYKVQLLVSQTSKYIIHQICRIATINFSPNIKVISSNIIYTINEQRLGDVAR